MTLNLCLFHNHKNKFLLLSFSVKQNFQRSNYIVKLLLILVSVIHAFLDPCPVILSLTKLTFITVNVTYASNPRLCTLIPRAFPFCMSK